MKEEIKAYHQKLNDDDQKICHLLYQHICREITTSEHKIWHGHPVWFINENPTVGYSKQKAGIRLMFWSGADFEEDGLSVRGAKFKDASIFYTSVEDLDIDELKRWLEKSKQIQWDYKNIVKRKGVLVRLS